MGLGLDTRPTQLNQKIGDNTDLVARQQRGNLVKLHVGLSRSCWGWDSWPRQRRWRSDLASERWSCRRACVRVKLCASVSNPSLTRLHVSWVWVKEVEEFEESSETEVVWRDSVKSKGGGRGGKGAQSTGKWAVYRRAGTG
jgi:hypothetical protein